MNLQSSHAAIILLHHRNDALTNNNNNNRTCVDSTFDFLEQGARASGRGTRGCRCFCDCVLRGEPLMREMVLRGEDGGGCTAAWRSSRDGKQRPGNRNRYRFRTRQIGLNNVAQTHSTSWSHTQEARSEGATRISRLGLVHSPAPVFKYRAFE